MLIICPRFLLFSYFLSFFIFFFLSWMFATEFGPDSKCISEYGNHKHELHITLFKACVNNDCHLCCRPTGCQWKSDDYLAKREREEEECGTEIRDFECYYVMQRRRVDTLCFYESRLKTAMLKLRIKVYKVDGKNGVWATESVKEP